MTRTHVTLPAALLAFALSTSASFAADAGIHETFATPWAPSANPSSFGEPTDGVFKMDGNYCVPYGQRYPDELNTANVAITHDRVGPLATLTVLPGTHTSQACGGVTAYGASEIATNAGWEPTVGPPPWGRSPYGYGYYEVRMRPSCVQGEISSFFWVGAPHYGPLEIDVEFPNPPGHSFTDVHWTIHPSGKSADFQLGFNPCQDFHDYGFLWTPGQVVFTVDRVAKQTFTDSSLKTTQTGFVMANAWTGNPNWGGGPPSEPAVNAYRAIIFLPDAAGIPPLALPHETGGALR